jgi:putative ABC transport system permease protein
VGLEKDYEITGVIQDVPANSHFTFDFLASFSSLELPVEEVWDSPNYQTYLLLHSNVNQEAFETKVNHTLLGEKNNEKKIRVQLHIQPLGNIHFDTTVANYMNKVSDKRYVLIFSIVAVLILLIASINYINLTTARAAERGREVGIRKAAGATGNQLFKQFMTDSIVHIAPAVILASLIFLSSIPFLDSYLGLNMNTSHTINYSLVILMSSAIFAGVTLFAGLYPAVILTRFKPALVLKGKFNFSSSATSFRKALVVFQFCISIALIICTLVISNQLEFMQQAKLGFEKEHTLILPMDSETEKNFSSIRSELNQLSSVQAVVPASAPPTEIIIGYGAFLDKDQKDVSTVGSMRTNADCIDALGMKLVQGRNFDPTRENIADAEPQFIVNQAFLSTFNLTVEEALGKKIFLGVARGEGEIIGIVQNFHAGSLHKKIEPIVLYDKNGWLNKILIKMTPGHVPDQLKEIGGVWGKLVPHRPFAFTFLDENYDRLYANEKRISILLKSFSSLAIFIACLGVLGLVSYATLQRTKEIGIRKVLGATVGHVMILISKDFVRLILIAFVLAVPLAYFSVSNWLENFEYRIGIGIPEFLLAGSLALGLALLTIIYQAVKASMINPAITLRSE